jgi:predicted RNA-binding protein with PIN domain
VRFFVDGMNVIGTRPDGWWRDRHGAMVALVDTLERWVARTGADVTVVFEQPPRPPIRSSLIEITHAPKAGPDSGDHELIRLLRADERPSQVRVVTSDRFLGDRALALGASVEPALAFRLLVEDDE